MTETPQDLLARLTGFCKNVAKMKCPCGHKSCSQYTLTTQGSVGFDLEDADLYAAAPRLHRELTDSLAHESGSRRLLEKSADLISAAIAREEALLKAIKEASDPDFLFSAMDNVRDMDVTLTDFAVAASKAIRAALEVKP